MTEKVKNTLYKVSMFLSVSLLIISLVSLLNWVFPREEKKVYGQQKFQAFQNTSLHSLQL